jgi:hypothetical protein
LVVSLLLNADKATAVVAYEEYAKNEERHAAVRLQRAAHAVRCRQLHSQACRSASTMRANGRAAMRALLLVVERGGDTMLPRIAIT